MDDDEESAGRSEPRRPTTTSRRSSDGRRAESARPRSSSTGSSSGPTRRGCPTEELTASPWSGRGRYRTGVTGWYLKRNRSIGVSTDGGYYVLVVAPERFGRWRRVSLPPTPPPLQVGKGGRDGDSVALDLLLDLRFDVGGRRRPDVDRYRRSDRPGIGVEPGVAQAVRCTRMTRRRSQARRMPPT